MKKHFVIVNKEFCYDTDKIISIIRSVSNIRILEDKNEKVRIESSDDKSISTLFNLIGDYCKIERKE